MDYRERFSKRLVQLREQRGITQQELADKLGITRQSLSLYEKAERTINIELLAKIADFFDVSADYLMGRTDVSSMNEDIQIACKVTGLSEISIEKLMDLYTKKWINGLERFINHSDFFQWVCDINFFLEDCERYIEPNQEKMNEIENKHNKVLEEIKNAGYTICLPSWISEALKYNIISHTDYILYEIGKEAAENAHNNQGG
ncbi:MAG: helix-turn-helix domain-containing protein [Porcipelethomonas sp.]